MAERPALTLPAPAPALWPEIMNTPTPSARSRLPGAVLIITNGSTDITTGDSSANASAKYDRQNDNSRVIVISPDPRLIIVTAPMAVPVIPVATTTLSGLEPIEDVPEMGAQPISNLEIYRFSTGVSTNASSLSGLRKDDSSHPWPATRGASKMKGLHTILSEGS